MRSLPNFNQAGRRGSARSGRATFLAGVAAAVAIAGGAATAAAGALTDPKPSAVTGFDECMQAVRGTADTLEHWSAVCLGDSSGGVAPVVVGNGADAVYVGVGPETGGDPAIGETAASYVARTGQQLPGLATAVPIDEGWWYGQAPVLGGDPALGETEQSYYARTGRHLPGG